VNGEAVLATHVLPLLVKDESQAVQLLMLLADVQEPYEQVEAQMVEFVVLTRSSMIKYETNFIKLI
jgi:hypothetical protein